MEGKAGEWKSHAGGMPPRLADTRSHAGGESHAGGMPPRLVDTKGKAGMVKGLIYFILRVKVTFIVAWPLYQCLSPPEKETAASIESDTYTPEVSLAIIR